MAGNKIEYAGRTFGHKDIATGGCFLSTSLSLESLPIDTLEVEVRSNDATLVDFKRGNSLKFYHDEALIGLFYVTDVERLTTNLYRISATSAVGIMDEDNHFGGIYTGQTAAEIIATMIPATISYTITEKIGNTKMYGWLPFATLRENLHQVLFASGGCLRKNADGSMKITALSGDVVGQISGDRIFPGGSVGRITPATRVEVTEHQFIENSEAETLFAGTSETGETVIFDEPMHSLSISGATILASGANYAKLSAGTVTLTGKKYNHTKKVVVAESGHKVAALPNVYTVSDRTLVSLVNSSNVASRVLSYYALRESIKEDIAVGAERPGDIVQLPHPFGGVAQGGIEELEVSFGRFLRAGMVLRCGFVPSAPPGNLYENMVILTGDGAWTAPAGCKKIRAILIGGGQPGGGGRRGSAGGDAGNGYAGAGGRGGVGGDGGRGGNIFELVKSISGGEVFRYSSGPANGGNSAFGPNTSASGAPADAGFTELTTGITYAVSGRAFGTSPSGKNAYYSGFGNQVSTYILDPEWRIVGAVGSTCELGGISCKATNSAKPGYRYCVAVKAWGCLWGHRPGEWDGRRGDDGVTFGSGGHGGGGGGGGNGAGGYSCPLRAGGTLKMRTPGGEYEDWLVESTDFPVVRGEEGGAGGGGGSGAPGCIILYY